MTTLIEDPNDKMNERLTELVNSYATCVDFYDAMGMPEVAAAFEGVVGDLLEVLCVH